MMTSEAATKANEPSSVRKSVIVRTPVDHAFRVFTERFDLWWPRAHHIGKAEMAAAVVEGKKDGRWYERGVDGSECEWGRVLEWTPPHRLVLSWHIGATWSYDPDPARASRVEVTFHDVGDGTTRVELVHSELDRHGDGWPSLRDMVASPGGWPAIVDRFEKAALETS